MSTRVTLTNFQSHAQTVMEIRSGFVCAIGPTNAGKSSIVRALRWALYDSLRGSRFIRAGQSSVSVAVRFDDGVEIERSKGKANRYRVNTTWFDTIGVGVPPEVVKATNVPVLQIDKDTTTELHVAMQLKAPLMVMDTDSAKAKFLNVLTGGHVIDASVRETNRLTRELEVQKKKLQDDLAHNQAEVVKYPNLEEREQRLQKVAKLLQELNMVNASKQKLETMKQSLAKIRHAKELIDLAYRKLRDKEGIINTLVTQLESLQTRLEAIQKIRQLRTQRIGVEHQKLSAIAELDQLQQQLLSMPDAPCENCGQTVTKDVREKHLHDQTAVLVR